MKRIFIAMLALLSAGAMAQTTPNIQGTKNAVFRLKMTGPVPTCVTHGTCPQTASILKAIQVYGLVAGDGTFSEAASTWREADLANLKNITVGKVITVGADGTTAADGQSGTGTLTATAPSATSYQVTLAWTLAADCTSTQPCVVIPYRQVGTSCPSTVAGSTGWTQLPATATQATGTTDATVTPGTSYEYFVEAQYAGQTGLSGPSNCIVVAVPLVPNPPSSVTGGVN